MVRPPEVLLSECDQPSEEAETETLKKLKNKDSVGAAVAHTKFVLDVRDAFEICNSKIRNIKLYFDKLEDQNKE